MNSSFNASVHAATHSQAGPSDSVLIVDSEAVLVREAGVPFQPPLAKVDPFVEWMHLMEAVQFLCPDAPARVKPSVGTQWRL